MSNIDSCLKLFKSLSHFYYEIFDNKIDKIDMFFVYVKEIKLNKKILKLYDINTFKYKICFFLEIEYIQFEKLIENIGCVSEIEFIKRGNIFGNGILFNKNVFNKNYYDKFINETKYEYNQFIQIENTRNKRVRAIKRKDINIKAIKLFKQTFGYKTFKTNNLLKYIL